MPDTSPRIARLRDEIAVDGAAAVDRFWREVTAAGTPLVEAADGEQALVTFLWRGHAADLAVRWGIRAALEREPGTDLWHATVRVPRRLRTIYYFHRDGASGYPRSPTPDGPAFVDPHNPRHHRFPRDPHDPDDGVAWTSLLELPDAPADRWSVRRPGVPAGRVLSASVPTTALGGRRWVWVYRPAGVPTTGLPVLVGFDGFHSRTVLRIPTTLDNLIAAGRIPPLVAVFVASPGWRRRLRELRPARPMVDFLTRELLPWARRRWQLTTDPERCVVAGHSLGGLAAAYSAFRAPQAFGAALCQSGSFWWPAPPEGEPEWLTRRLEATDRLPLRFYLDVGSLATAQRPRRTADLRPCQTGPWASPDGVAGGGQSGTSGLTSLATNRTNASGAGSSAVGCSTTVSAPASAHPATASATAGASPATVTSCPAPCPNRRRSPSMRAAASGPVAACR
jgi:enterochelin esterase family protein